MGKSSFSISFICRFRNNSRYTTVHSPQKNQMWPKLLKNVSGHFTCCFTVPLSSPLIVKCVWFTAVSPEAQRSHTIWRCAALPLNTKHMRAVHILISHTDVNRACVWCDSNICKCRMWQVPLGQSLGCCCCCWFAAQRMWVYRVHWVELIVTLNLLSWQLSFTRSSIPVNAPDSTLTGRVYITSKVKFGMQK